MVVLGLHFGVRYAVMERLRSAASVRKNVVTSVASDVLLLLGFLLHYDAGDGLGWLAISALVTGSPGAQETVPPAWWPAALTFPGVVFGPLVVSWWYLLTSRTRETRRPPQGVSPIRGPSIFIGLFAGLILLFAAGDVTQLVAHRYDVARLEAGRLVTLEIRRQAEAMIPPPPGAVFEYASNVRNVGECAWYSTAADWDTVLRYYERALREHGREVVVSRPEAPPPRPSLRTAGRPFRLDANADGGAAHPAPDGTFSVHADVDDGGGQASRTRFSVCSSSFADFNASLSKTR
jgi:hypothetical protein